MRICPGNVAKIITAQDAVITLVFLELCHNSKPPAVRPHRADCRAETVRPDGAVFARKPSMMYAFIILFFLLGAFAVVATMVGAKAEKSQKRIMDNERKE